MSSEQAAPRKVPSWDAYYLGICRMVAARSKDPNTQIGCVIVGPSHEIRSTGYNSFPRGIRDDAPERSQRPAKYLWMEHAERNAIYNAARAGTSTEGCSIYVEIMPCMDCARGIVQAGIPGTHEALFQRILRRALPDGGNAVSGSGRHDPAGAPGRNNMTRVFPERNLCLRLGGTTAAELC